MPSYSSYASPTSPPSNRWRDHSPQKSSPLRHTISTRSNTSTTSDTDHSSLPSRQGTLRSNASSAYTNGSLSGYDSASDPFVTRPAPPTNTTTTPSPALKRDRSESPVKKNAAFAKWEQREQAEQKEPQRTPTTSHRRAQTMDISPRKVKDDDWRAGLGKNESRAALRPVASNTLPAATPDMPPPSQPRAPARLESPSRKENGGHQAYQVEEPDGLMAPPPKPPNYHARGKSMDSGISPSPEPISSSSPSSKTSKNSMATLSRSDSMRGSTRPRERGHVRFGSTDERAPHLDGEDLVTLQKSTTPQFRHLSKMASEDGGGEDYSIHSPEQQVHGLAGRRRLQRSGSTRPSTNKQSAFGSQFASTRWMDTQRKHLQAYEYLCHIGEARAWIEDVLDPVELPPIVQLEESFRNGVTLAEVVVRLSPSLPPESQRALGSHRIFRNDRLQFRHSDNIALFFRFLSTIELPELFRFELVDLYEKKNVPKVIYCIHALSWLLYRKGIVEFRIGNLVGQLEFAEHELEETQKGIDRSGVAMPNFGGMREAMQVEPEPEPEPSPEDLVREQEDVVVELQAQMRGALMRMRLGDVMQDLWNSEDSIALFQAVARGNFAREIFDFKFTMDRSTRQFQTAAKAFLLRRKLHQKQRTWKDNTKAVVKMQSLWRGRQQRAETRQIKTQLSKNRHGVKDLQSAIRGALGRWRAGDVWHETQQAGQDVEDLQAQARGMLERQRIGAIMNELWDVEDSIILLQALMRAAHIRKTTKHQKAATRKAAVDVVRLQALARGLIQRKEQKKQHGSFQMHHETLIDLQSAAKGLLARRQHISTKNALERCSSGSASLQAIARGQRVRTQTAELREKLRRENGKVVDLQSLARAMRQRRSIGTQLAAVEKDEDKIQTLQALARAYIQRTRVYEQLVDVGEEEAGVTELQALARAMLERARVGHLLNELEQYEADVEDIQSAARAFMVRRTFAAKQEHFKDNMAKVIKLQSFVRAKQQGESYKSLVNGKNPPLPVVRKHLHLLTDSTLEFEGEIEAERLRRQVVESVRRNELVEGYVEGLDVKIALLVKNKITLDEVVKHQKHFGGSASQLLRNGSTMGNHSGSGFDLKALNKSSRKKLSGYEELFFMLQTQPIYLARLFQALSGKGLPEKDAKHLEGLMLTLFGYAQKSREEYFLLKLIGTSIRQTIAQAKDVEDHQRMLGAAFHQRLLLSYVRSPKDRGYLKTLLGGLVKEGVCGQDHLDLESDPLQIYRAILNNDELSTGRPSDRPRDLPREVVIREPDVRPRYVEHLQDLRDLGDAFFSSLEETLHRMPYGIRFTATEQYRALCDRFPHDDPAHLAMTAGSWLWKSYLLPALREPEMWGVIDRGLSPLHKRNLAQVTTVVGQVATGRLFSAENVYLQPLNNWISESLERWQECLNRLFEMQNPEEWFDADQFSDLYSRNKPTVYVKLADIFGLHSMVADNVAYVAPNRDDPIKELLTDLGTAKSNESDLSSAAHGSEITLTLKNKYTVQEDPNAEARQLFTATKRLVLYIIKVQSGSNLMEILLRPVEHEDADRWIQLLREEVAEQDRANRRPNPRNTLRNSMLAPQASLRGGRALSVYSEAPSTFSEDHRDLLDLQSTTYAELKSSALENILALEAPSIPAPFRVSRHNNYQELLNALASDIRQKHRRRLERVREVDATRATLAQLDAKAAFLDDQLQSYNDYIEQCLHTLSAGKKDKRRFVLPFTKQWSHERELERAGRQPRFGSYKYSLRQLADKGVLLSWPAYGAEHWGQLDVVVSSDEVGVFHLEASAGSIVVPGGSANLLLDDLLQAQFEGRQSVEVFAGAGGKEGARLGVNLLLHLVFKKFYRDE